MLGTSPFRAAVQQTTRTFHVKNGYTVPLAGAPVEELSDAPAPQRVAVRPADFFGLRLKLLVREGDAVKAGQPLMTWKDNRDVTFASPGGGTVTNIRFGPRRVVEEIEIQLSDNEEWETFEERTLEQIMDLGRAEILEGLSKGGLMPLFLRRPLGKVANPAETPRCIFVNGMNTAPCAPDPYYLVKDKLPQVKTALDLLSKLCSGTVYLCLGTETPAEPLEIAGISERPRIFETHRFSGQHPAGLSGTHIWHLDKILSGKDLHWTIRLEDLPLIAEFFTTGKFPVERRLAVSGPGVIAPKYVNTRLGAPVADILTDNLKEGELRVVSGNILNGSTVRSGGFSGYYDSQLTVLEEGRKKEFLGWLMPGLNKFTRTKAFIGSMLPRRSWNLDTNLHGAVRPFILDDVYDEVVGVDILPSELSKAIITEDLEEAEKLGLYDVIEEDLALCTFVCPSKIDFGKILREGLDLYEKEG